MGRYTWTWDEPVPRERDRSNSFRPGTDGDMQGRSPTGQECEEKETFLSLQQAIEQLLCWMQSLVLPQQS